MEKSKLGISIGLLSAITFLSGYAGITAMVLVVGYILLREENMTLKKNAVSTVVLYLVFLVLSMCIGALDNVLSFLDFGNWMYKIGFSIYSNALISKLNVIVYLAEKVVFGLLALFALSGKEVKLPFVDKFVEKHF